jgi:hypothetical protein
MADRMSKGMTKAAVQRVQKGQDELNELRRKTKHQEAALRTLTQVFHLKRTQRSFCLTNLII